MCQKRDRCCRKLVRTTGRHSDLMLNHEGLLIKQASILRNTYQVYVVPQSLVQRVIKIFHDNRGHQGISRTINMMKMLLVQKNARAGQHICKQVFVMLPTCDS